MPISVCRRSSQPDLYQLWNSSFLKHKLAVELGHAAVLFVLFKALGSRPQLLFAGVFCDAELLEVVLGLVGDDLVLQDQMMLRTTELHALAAGKNLMPAVLLIPLGQRGGHVHLLDDVPPSHPGVVRAKRDLPL